MRVVLEVERELLVNTLGFIKWAFKEAQIERIEQIPYREKSTFHITFRTEKPVMDIIETLRANGRLDQLKLIEGV